MTRRARRPCSQPACAETVPGGGYCPEHGRLADRRRGSAHARGYGAKWRATAARYLAQLAAQQLDDQVRCEHCGATADERGAGPLHVDHIDGFGPNGPRGHDPDNLQALCAVCHGSKTRHQTGTAGAPQT